MVTEKSVHLDDHHYRCIVIAKDGEWEVRQEPDTEAVARLFRRSWAGSNAL